jgi:hypothetical protein
VVINISATGFNITKLCIVLAVYNFVHMNFMLFPNLCTFLLIIARSQNSTISIATGWAAKGLLFKSWQGQDPSPLHVVEIGSGAHLASYPMGIGSSFPRGKTAKLTTRLKLVLSSRISGSIHPLLNISSWPSA